MLAHWNNSLWVDMSLNFGHIILIPSQPLFALIPCLAKKQQVHILK